MDFERDVVQASYDVPVLVDFWAPWCAPCRVLGPVLDHLAESAAGKWRLVKVNTDENPDAATRWRVSGIPAVKLFVDGDVAGEFTGALPESEVKKFLDNHLPSSGQKELAQARRELAAGRRDSALERLERIISEEPGLAEARLLVAEHILRDEPQRAAELLQPIADTDPIYPRVEAVLNLARLRDLLDTEELAAEPGWDVYASGIRAFFERRDEDALTAWLEVVKTHRKLDDDGARRASVALFSLLGDEHPLTQRYRREFAMAMY